MNTNQSIARKHAIVIVDGGASGTAAAARLPRALPDLDIAVLEPASFHDYQPAWTLVGDGHGNAARYDGYAACPLTTSVGKVMLADFSYRGVI